MRSYIKTALALLVAISASAWTHGKFVTSPGGPTISSVRPNGGATTFATPVTITGTNFATGAGATTFKFGSGSATGISCSSSTTCTASSPATGGVSTIDVVATVAGNQSPINSGDQFSYANWQQVLTAGYADINSVHIGGTELRSQVTHRIPNGDKIPESAISGSEITCSSAWAQWDGTGCPIIVASNGFWGETSCPANTAPQVLTLVSPTSKFNQDHTLQDTIACPGVGDWANSLFNLTFTVDGTGVVVGPIQILAASGTGSQVDTRDDSTGTWSTGLSGQGGADRSLGSHIDLTVGTGNGIQYMLIGNDAAGIYHGTLNHGTNATFTYSTTPEPWSNGTCSNSVTCTNWNSDWAGLSPSLNTCATFTGALNGASPNVLTVTAATKTDLGIQPGSVITGTSIPANTTVTDFITGSGGNGTYHVTGSTSASARAMTDVRVSACNQSFRILGIADCTNSTGARVVYLSIDNEIWQRVDAGASSTWTLDSVMPPSEISSDSQSGLRGLTCITNPSGPGQVLLSTTEAGLPTEHLANFWRIDPVLGLGVGSDAGWTDEGATQDLYNAQYSCSPASSCAGYSISSYNDMAFIHSSWVWGMGTQFINTVPSGHTNFIGAPAGHLEWIGGLWVRQTSGASGGTTTVPVFQGIPENNTQYAALKLAVGGGATPMIATRNVVCSPFPTDQDATGACQYAYFGGTDVNSAPLHNNAWSVRFPLGPFAIP